MRAGLLRHRVLVDEAIDTQDAAGAPVRTWQLLTTVPASIEAVRGRERLTANQLIADMDTRIRVRWSPLMAGLTARHRLRHGSTVYNIVSIAPDRTERRELEIMCLSGANQG